MFRVMTRGRSANFLYRLAMLSSLTNDWYRMYLKQHRNSSQKDSKRTTLTTKKSSIKIQLSHVCATSRCGLLAKRVLAAVGDVEEAIHVLLFFVNVRHESSRWREDVVDEDEDCLLRAQFDALSNHVDELADGQIGGHQVLLLINVRNVAAVRLLANHWDPVRVLRSDALRFGLALLERVFLLE